MKLWDAFLRRKAKTHQTLNQPQERYILCIDGGGMRGIIPVMVLEMLEQKIRKAGGKSHIASYFDLVAGTSTGGLIALALTCPTTLDHEITDNYDQVELTALENIYLTKGSEIFQRNKGDFLGLSQVATNKYSKAGIERLLLQWFTDSTMKEAVVPTFVSTYDLSRGTHFGINNIDNPDFPVRVAARATSSAPTYFAPVKLEDQLLVDGGVIANNPALYAYAKARELYPDCRKFHIVSISTGATVHTMEESETSGILSWLDKVVPMYSTAQKSTCDFVVSALSDVEYIRIDQPLENEIKMDDTNPASLEYLRNFGLKLADSYQDKIEELAQRLIKNKSEN